MPGVDLGVEVLCKALHETAGTHNLGEGPIRAQAPCDSEESHTRRAEKMLKVILSAMNEEHVVEFSETGYGLQHPFKCRPNLLGCAYSMYLDRKGGPEKSSGKYAMHLTHSTAEYRQI